MLPLTITDLRVLPGDSAFLIDDGQTAILYDSGFAFTGHELADKIRRTLGERPLDFIFLTHSHYDHALGAAYVKRSYPDAKIAASSYAAKIFAKPSARALMRQLDQDFAKASGVTAYEDLIDELQADILLEDGDVIEAGSLRFTAVSLPGHTLCSMGFYEESRHLLLACETSGVYHGKTISPCFLKSLQMTLDSIRRMEKMKIESLVAPHHGFIEGDEAAFYLQNAYAFTDSAAQAMAQVLRDGGSIADAQQLFCSRFLPDHIRPLYPPAAMELNSRIMAQTVQKELVL